MENNYISALPIAPHLDGICAALKSSPSRSLVLTAQTAAGKSTAVPVALLHHFTGKIIMLQPRRIAALAVASRVAELLGEKVGETAGLVMRMERRVSGRTRFVVMTEGVLTRMLQSDSALDGVDAVVLDEAHERSVNTDLALAFLKEAQILRDDLFVLVMSATMDSSALAAYMGTDGESAPVLDIPGRLYPVETVYRGGLSVSDAIMEEYHSLQSGDVMLVFLPGIKEIRQVQSDIANIPAEVMVLHSSVPLEEQRRVLAPPSPASPVRIVLASAIAETSLTVPGVKVVIDSGLSRINRMNVASGMSSLVTETESTFSAEQRRGRAGRTGPGKCVRLWAESDKRLDKVDPEILRSDIIPLVLECSLWCGVCDANKLQWLTTPASGAWDAARDTLVMMGLLEVRQAGVTMEGGGFDTPPQQRKSGGTQPPVNEDIGNQYHITDKGRAALQLGVHPRLACVAMAGVGGSERESVKCAVDYSDYAASPMRRRAEADLMRRLGALKVKITTNYHDRAMFLLEGFPDRLAHIMEDQSYRFPSGRAASLKEARGALPQWIVAPVVNAGDRTGRVLDWEPVSDDDAESYLAAHSSTRTESQFTGYKLHQSVVTHYGKIVLSRRDTPVTHEGYTAAVCRAVEENGLEWLPLGEAAREFIKRARFYAQHRGGACVLSGSPSAPMSGLPSAPKACIEAIEGSDDELSRTAREWLAPFITGTSLTEKAVLDALRYRMDGEAVDRMVPRRLTLPNGTTVRVMYEATGGDIRPTVEVIIQRVFGLVKTPVIMGVPVTFKLLSPARRPVQVTSDLAGFWHGTWQEVAREMRGRYPKHNWDYVPQ